MRLNAIYKKENTLEVLKQKANLQELNNLHGLVAAHLSKNLDDPKILAVAVKFLKDNNITTDIIESETVISLTDSIKKIAKESKVEKFSVEDMLELDFIE